MKIIHWISALCFLGGALLPVASAATVDRDAALAKVHQRIETSDFRATGRLVLIGAGGKRTTYKLSIKGHWFPDGMHLLYEATGPSAGKERVLLHMNPDGHTSIQVQRADAPKPTTLGIEHGHDAFLGSNFSYEDLMDSQFYWKNQSLLQPDRFGTRDCAELKSIPSVEVHSQYGSVASCLDSQILYPLHVLKTLKSGGQKEFVYSGLRQTSGVWSATQVQVKEPGSSGPTLLVVERGSAKAKLTRKDFDLASPVAQDKQ